MFAPGARHLLEMMTAVKAAETPLSVANHCTAISAQSVQRGKLNSVVIVRLAGIVAEKKERWSNRRVTLFELEVVPEILTATVADATPGLHLGEGSEPAPAHGRLLDDVSETTHGAGTAAAVLRVSIATCQEAPPLDEPERMTTETLGVGETMRIEIDAVGAMIGRSWPTLTATFLVAVAEQLMTQRSRGGESGVGAEYVSVHGIVVTAIGSESATVTVTVTVTATASEFLKGPDLGRGESETIVSVSVSATGTRTEPGATRWRGMGATVERKRRSAKAKIEALWDL